MKEKESKFVGYIYGLYDPNTDELRYVGYTTKSLSTRLSQHISESKHKNKSHRHRWLRKLNGENVKPNIKPIKTVTHSDKEILLEHLWLLEDEFIQKFIGDGYNLVNGKDGGKGGVFTEEVRRRMSEAQKGEKSVWFGKTHTEETKRKISESNKGKVLSEETKKRIGEKSKGRFFSEESRKKMGEHNIGKKVIHSEETRKKISDNHIDVSGENNPSAKLTWDLVNEIRGKYINGLMRKEIVSVYDIPDSTIGSILQNRSWICSQYDEKLENKKPKIKEIRELYLNGHSINEIMKIHNHPKSTLTKIVYNITWVCSDYQNSLNKKRGL